MFKRNSRYLYLILIALMLVLIATPAFAAGECPSFTLPIRYGDTVTGTIDDKNYAVVYCLSVSRGDEIEVELSATRGDLDTLLVISSTTGEEVYANNDDASSTDKNSAIKITLDVSGNILIVASRYKLDEGSTTGSFRLTLRNTRRVVPTSPPTGATGGSKTGSTEPTVSDTLADCGKGASFITPLTVNTAVTGEITNTDTFKAFCFTAKRGDELTFSARNSSGNLDPVAVLTDTDLNVIERGDDISSSDSNVLFTATIPADGMYYISVSRFGGDSGRTTGEFSLLVSKPYTCDEPPLSYLLAGRWVNINDKGDVTIALTFTCNGKVTIETAEVISDVYTFEGTTLSLGDDVIVFENVIIVEGIMMGELSGELFMLVTEDMLDD